MGFDLTSSNGATIQWTGVYWRLMLAVAEHYGWQPSGTSPPNGVDSKSWSGTYETNDGQMVEEEDVAALARSLGRAIDAEDLVDVANSIHRARMLEAQAEADRLLAEMGIMIDGEPTDLVGRLKTAIRSLRGRSPKPAQEPSRIPRDEISSALSEFLEFCEHGPFQIW